MATPELQIEKLVTGTGAAPKNGDTVNVHYTGTFTNGQKFDSPVDRNEPFSFVLGAGRVITGWELGVAQMKTGDKVKLTYSTGTRLRSRRPSRRDSAQCHADLRSGIARDRLTQCNNKFMADLSSRSLWTRKIVN